MLHLSSVESNSQNLLLFMKKLKNINLKILNEQLFHVRFTFMQLI